MNGCIMGEWRQQVAAGPADDRLAEMLMLWYLQHLEIGVVASPRYA